MALDTMRPLLAAVLILFAPPAMARDTSVLLHFQAVSHGLAVLRLDAALRLSSTGYGLRVAYHTVGVAGFFYPGQEDDSVSGTWDEAGPQPSQYLAEGTWHGHWRQTRLVYHAQVPTIAAAIPPIAQERIPVPPDLLPGTIDTLSALVGLIRRVDATGACDTTVRVFDGRRLSRIEARTGTASTLQAEAGSVFSGTALRCDFTGQMLAGFMLDHPRGEPGRPYHGSAWLARLAPGGPPLPVRLSFQTHWLGDVTMYLEGIDPGQ